MYGSPQIWFTNNISELNDPHMMLVIGHDKLKISISRAAQAKLAALDPFASAEWFARYNALIILELFGYDVKRRRAVRRGILGEAKAGGGATECTARGGLHGHNLFWMRELQLINELVVNPRFLAAVRHQVSAFVDSIVCSHLAAVPDHTPAHMVPSSEEPVGPVWACQTCASIAPISPNDVSPVCRSCNPDGLSEHVVELASQDPALLTHTSNYDVPAEEADVITFEDGSLFDSNNPPSAGTPLTVRSYRPPRTFVGTFVEVKKGFVLVRRHVPADQPIKGRDLDHTLVSKTMRVKCGNTHAEQQLHRTRPLLPPEPTADDHEVSAFGEAFLARAADAYQKKVDRMRRGADGRDDGMKRLDRSWTAESPLNINELVVLNIRDDSVVHVAEVIATTDDDVTFHLYAHYTDPSTEYDFEQDPIDRREIAKEWVTADDSWYSAPRRRSVRDEPKVCTIPTADCNILARGFKLEARGTLRRCLPTPVCDVVTTAVDEWSDDDGLTPLLGADSWLRSYLPTIGGLQVGVLLHGERTSSQAAREVQEGDRCTGRRCRLVCTKTEQARKHGTCRLGYGSKGRPLVARTHVDESGRIMTRRNYEHLVPHSIALTLMLRCSK